MIMKPNGLTTPLVEDVNNFGMGDVGETITGSIQTEIAK